MAHSDGLKYLENKILNYFKIWYEGYKNYTILNENILKVLQINIFLNPTISVFE